jgi:hypothetical protein
MTDATLPREVEARVELADVDFPDQRRDVLIVFVAGFGLGDADLAKLRGVHLDDAKLLDDGKLRQIAVELI